MNEIKEIKKTERIWTCFDKKDARRWLKIYYGIDAIIVDVRLYCNEWIVKYIEK